MSLKYLFQVTYKDGSIYKQNIQDESVKFPAEQRKSCYADIDQDQVKSFFLFNDEHTYSVNLLDGHFEVDGVPFFMHEHRILKDFRLIYFRQHTHSFHQRMDGQSQPVPVSHDVVFRFGWQTNDPKGNNVQRVMEIW